MLNAKLKIFVLIFACQLLFVTQALSNEIRIAVASNFYSTMQEIIVQFELENIDTSKSNEINYPDNKHAICLNDLESLKKDYENIKKCHI